MNRGGHGEKAWICRVGLLLLLPILILLLIPPRQIRIKITIMSRREKQTVIGPPISRSEGCSDSLCPSCSPWFK
jgi:hypothetical protein